MGRKGITVAAALILLGLSTLSAFEERLHLGGADRWPEMVRLEHILVRPGFRGTDDLYLRDASDPVVESTDLFLDFDRLPLRDSAGRYAVHAADAELTAELRRAGDAAAVFRMGRGRIDLEPLTGAAFQPGTFWDSLTIEYWLNPATLQDGDVLFEWDGSMRRRGKIVPQHFRVFVENRRLVWEFVNMFIPPDGHETTIRLTSHEGLVPRRWQHHHFRYDSRTGAIEYLVDNRPEGFAFATSTGTEAGDSYAAFVGELGRGQLKVGTRFSGAIDELRISHHRRLPPVDPALFGARQPAGIAITQPIPLGSRGGRIVGIDATFRTPGDSGIGFAYRVGSEPSSVGGLDDEWQPFVPGAGFDQPVQGRYLQLRFELMPDAGSNANPRLSDVEIRYEPVLPPPRPTGLVATPSDRAVELEWNPIRGRDVAGYIVFYGETPGSYFGEEATAGRSPIDVGNVTDIQLEGLTNGRSYYFAVAAYGPSGILDSGALSSEVSVRPSRVAPWR